MRAKLTVLAILMAIFRYCAYLVHVLDVNARSALDVSSPLVKIALQSRLLFCGRYEVEERAVHISRTCKVYFAEDLMPRFQHYEAIAAKASSSASHLGLQQTQRLMGKLRREGEEVLTIQDKRFEEKGRGLPVALKFMNSLEGKANH